MTELKPSPIAPPIREGEVEEIDARLKESETMQSETPIKPPTCPEEVLIAPMLNERLILG